MRLNQIARNTLCILSDMPIKSQRMKTQKDNTINVIKAIECLDTELASMGCNYTIYTCGGASLILLGFSSRATEDVDVIQTKIDAPLEAAAAIVARKFQYNKEWLNNQVHDLGRRLGKGWKRRTSVLYTGEALCVRSISRQDLINSKFHALVNRQGEDLPDVVFLNPSDEELRIAVEYTTAQGETDGIETQSVFANGWLKLVKQELGRK